VLGAALNCHEQFVETLGDATMLEAQRVVLPPAGAVRTEGLNINALKETSRVVSATALLAVSYYLAARLGLSFRFQNSQIGVVWAANAVFLSALILARRERWWIVLVTTAAMHALVMYEAVPAWRWSWQIVGNSVFVLTTVAMLSRFAGLPLHFGSRRQVFAYLVISFALPALYSFTTPTFVRSVLGLESLYGPFGAWQRTLFSNATALLLVAPVVILGAQHAPRRLRQLPARRLVEAVLMIGTVLAVGALAFGFGPEITRFPLLLLWPPLLWAALRFGPIGASAALFCIAALSIWGTEHQMGPFVQITRSDQVTSLQMFWIMLSAPVMLLAATIREREQAEAALQQQRNQLAHITRLSTVVSSPAPGPRATSAAALDSRQCRGRFSFSRQSRPI
jgi:integral membrane sensor domain MASE1